MSIRDIIEAAVPCSVCADDLRSTCESLGQCKTRDGIEAIERGLDAGHELATIARDNAAEADKWRKVAERLSTSVAVAHWHMLVVHGHEPSDGYIERGAQVELAEVLTAVEQEADHE